VAGAARFVEGSEGLVDQQDVHDDLATLNIKR
jgi:hypothetical protein